MHAYKFWWKIQKERDRYEDVYIGERIILKWILEKCNGELWAGFMWLRIGISGVMNAGVF
jgi:hypothetical protein